MSEKETATATTTSTGVTIVTEMIGMGPMSLLKIVKLLLGMVEIEGGTTDSAVVDEDTTEGVHIAEDVGSGEPDPPAC